MKITKKQLAVSIVSIAILVISAVIMVLDAVIPLDIWVHPVLTFLFCLFVGFGILTLVLAFKRQSPWMFFISSILIGFAFIYAFSCSVPKFWWISLILVVTVWFIFALFSFIISGNKTESIALNASPEYKDYKQRRKEKEEEEKNKPKEELPEIKSFK